MADRDGTEYEGYRDWPSLELAIKDAAKKAAVQAGPGVSSHVPDIEMKCW